jgi:Kelch motif
MDATQCRGAYWAHPYLFRYDPRREEWQRLADMLFAVSHIESQVLVLDGKILVVGGTGDRDVFSARVQEYDPVRDRWRQMKALPQARKGGVVWQTNDRVYFNGGQLTSDGTGPARRGRHDGGADPARAVVLPLHARSPSPLSARPLALRGRRSRPYSLLSIRTLATYRFRPSSTSRASSYRPNGGMR